MQYICHIFDLICPDPHLQLLSLSLTGMEWQTIFPPLWASLTDFCKGTPKETKWVQRMSVSEKDSILHKLTQFKIWSSGQ